MIARSLGRAVSHYVGSSSGGARTAAARMGSARGAGSRLLGFLSDAVARGATEALRSLNLDGLAGRPIEEIFLGLADYVCPDGGSIDEGIAREAFIETIADLAGAGITDPGQASPPSRCRPSSNFTRRMPSKPDSATTSARER